MEDYEQAAASRLDDWEILSAKEHRRKACSIHMGGIYLECLLKEMLCSLCSVMEGTRKTEWVIDGDIINRPGHSLILSIYTNYLSTEDMLKEEAELVLDV